MVKTSCATCGSWSFTNQWGIWCVKYGWMMGKRWCTLTGWTPLIYDLMEHWSRWCPGNQTEWSKSSNNIHWQLSDGQMICKFLEVDVSKPQNWLNIGLSIVSYLQMINSRILNFMENPWMISLKLINNAWDLSWYLLQCHQTFGWKIPLA